MRRIPLLCLLLILSANKVFAEVTAGDIKVDNSNISNATSGGSFYNSSGGSVSQNFEASKNLPGTPGVSASSPTLFSLQGYPAQVKGLSLLMNNLFYSSYHDVAIGSSGGTKIIFNGTFPAEKPRNKDRNVYLNLTGIGNGEVIGSITIQSRKNSADEVDFSTLLYDARQYVAGIEELKGYNVTLLTISNTVSYSIGVDGKASGFTLAPLISGFLSGPTGAMGGLATGFATNGGVTSTTGLVGCTFLVLVDSEQSRVVDLTVNYNTTDHDGNGNGNNKKKYEATKQEDEK
ncbi:MAG: hypothetical protein HGB06_02865 [Chlorobaculum sp.]|jgi:hypothetical protein|nr:hypothetical protein [Chlorobaculum sp.]